MERLINRVEKIPVSLGNLKKFVPNNTACILYTDLKENLFPTGKTCVIVLLENKDSNIGHFILLIKRPQTVEYWSSYGNKPEYAIKKTGNDDRLLRYLPRKYIFNRYKFQNQINSETCAMHTLTRAIFYEMSNEDYIKLFKYKVSLKNPDDIVTIMCLNIRHQMASE